MEHRSQFLIVDDMEINRAILCELFRQDYDLLEAENGQEALELIHQYRSSIAVILLDIVMPVMDGFQLMEHLQRDGILQRIPVILITADTFHENELNGLNLGAVDLIMKPFDPLIVKKRVENNVELYHYKNHLEDLVEHQTRKLTEANDFMVEALSTVIEYRSLETGQHNRRIRVFTKILLQCLAKLRPDYGLTPKQISAITSASAMHDIGKIAIPESILLKPGRLTQEEFAIMKTHTTKGCEALRAFREMEDKAYLRYCYDICRHHHERWDGKGYPDGLKGDEIPVSAQAVAVADVYDALTSPRVYKPAFPHEKAIEMILNGECGSFSDSMMECLRQSQELFQSARNAYSDSKEESLDSFVDFLLSSPEEPEEALPASGEFQKASAALQKDALERDALINAVPGGVAKVSVQDDFKILMASAGFYKLIGYTPLEFRQPPLEARSGALILPEDRPKVRETVRLQLAENRPIQAEYRIRRKDGSIAVLRMDGTQLSDGDSSPVVQAIYTDVTESHRTQELLRINEERYRILIEQAQDVMFEWDIHSDQLYYSPVFQRKYGYDLPTEQFSRQILQCGIVFPEDHDAVSAFGARLLAGHDDQELEFRMNSGDGYRWCRVKMTLVFDQDHKPQRGVGTLSDVDDYKRANALLRERAQKDLLTGVYNKITTENLIQECLNQKSKQQHVLLLLDIDNFKTVNDTLGHMEGDRLLREIGRRLREHFRDQDIVGRIGGDEFMVFLRNIPSPELAMDKAQMICQVFREIGEDMGSRVPISASVGVALHPRDGRDFAELFRHADQAAYVAKRGGKNRACLYNPEADGPKDTSSAN